MTVGDVVNGILQAANGTINFQPAAGVECVIFTFSGGNTSAGCGIKDGTYSSRTEYGFSGTNAVGSRNPHTMKLCINNTNYFFAAANNYPPAYSGVQIK
jgi:hypothetical protein